jgi:hypothetical protein
VTYAIVADVERELGRSATSPAESDQWSAWLGRVERSITRRFVDVGLVLADEISAGTVNTEDLKDVEVAAVLRKIHNPTGVTSVTRSVDDASVTTRREGDGEGADPLVPTAAEWSALLPGRQAVGAFTIRPGFVPDTDEIVP